jgi:hypothetical protein
LFNITQRLSWFPSLATAAILGLMTLLSGCGGGGASSELDLPMTVVPASAVAYAYADTPTVLTIRSGKKPFNVYSSNTAIISFNPATMPQGQVPDEAIVLEGPTGAYGRVNNVNEDTAVTLTIRDAEGTQVNVVVTVKPSSLNTSLTVTDPLKSGVQGSVSVRATTVSGGPVVGHQVRFRVTDQGAAYGFVCNQSLGNCLVIETDSAGRIITVETTTDSNGDALAVIKADVGASTQYATISATDMNTGHVLRKQFTIEGLALAALPTTATWTITDSLAGAGEVYSCVGAATSFYVYGGTAPYTITSTVPSIVTVGGASTTTVSASGGTFVAQAACSASGTANLIITDAAGAILANITFVVTFVPTP